MKYIAGISVSILFTLFGVNTFVQNGNFLFIILGVVLLALTVLLIYFYRQKKAAAEQATAMQQEKDARIEELVKTNAIKDKLISIISHDMKSPLASLQTTLALTREGILEKDEFNKLSEGIEGDIYQLRSMLDNMLLWGREQVTDITIKKVSFNIHDIAEEIITMHKTGIKAKNITVQNFILPDTMVFTDKDIITTGFRNIFSNAVKFTPPGKRIFVQQMELNKKIYISVKDEGDGIPDEILQKIYNREFISTRGTANEKGTGIGMSFSRELFDKLGETFSISTAKAKGTSVTFSVDQA